MKGEKVFLEQRTKLEKPPIIIRVDFEKQIIIIVVLLFFFPITRGFLECQSRLSEHWCKLSELLVFVKKGYPNNHIQQPK